MELGVKGGVEPTPTRYNHEEYGACGKFTPSQPNVALPGDGRFLHFGLETDVSNLPCSSEHLMLHFYNFEKMEGDGDIPYFQESLRTLNSGKDLGSRRQEEHFGALCNYDNSIKKIMNISSGVGVFSQRVFDSTILPTINGLHCWHKFASADQFLENFLPQFTDVRVLTEKDFGIESLLDPNIFSFLKSLMLKGLTQVEIMTRIFVAKHACCKKISVVIVNPYQSLLETFHSDEAVTESVFVHTYSNDDPEDHLELHLYLFMISFGYKFSLKVFLIIACFILKKLH